MSDPHGFPQPLLLPTRHWFLTRLRRFFPKEIAGQSIRSGSATSLAEAGADLATIQAIGRWSSEAFRIYIRKNPVLIHAILFGRSVWNLLIVSEHAQYAEFPPIFVSMVILSIFMLHGI